MGFNVVLRFYLPGIFILMDPRHVVAWRRRLRLTRVQAGAELGISPHTIKSYELGKRSVPAPTAALMVTVEQRLRPGGSQSGAALRILGGAVVIRLGAGPGFVAVDDPGALARLVLSVCQAHDRTAELQLTRLAQVGSRYGTPSDLAALGRSWREDPRARVVFWMPSFPDADIMKAVAEFLPESLERPDMYVDATSASASRKSIGVHSPAGTDGASSDMSSFGTNKNVDRAANARDEEIKAAEEEHDALGRALALAMVDTLMGVPDSTSLWRRRPGHQVLVLGQSILHGDVAEQLRNTRDRSGADIIWGWTGQGRHLILGNDQTVLFDGYDREGAVAVAVAEALAVADARDGVGTPEGSGAGQEPVATPSIKPKALGHDGTKSPQRQTVPARATPNWSH